MSHENVEAIRRAHEAVNRRDLQGFLDVSSPDVDFRPALESGVEGEAAVYVGHEGLRRWWRQNFEDWAEFTTEIHDIRTVGDHILVSITIRARAAISGAPIEASLTQVFTLYGGKITSGHDYFDEDAALDAVGLAE
jgi:ketosteroid isomerase-like protein